MGTLLTGTLSHADELAFFEQRIRPVLIEHCYQCHSSEAGESEGSLLLDSQEAMLRGGDSGPAIVPGKPEQSLLLEAMRYESLEMPPSGKLDKQILADFEHWIESGAVDPRDGGSPRPDEAEGFDWESEREYWAFRSPTSPPVPQPTDWSRAPADAFVYDKLADHELSPAPEADRATWLRRVTYGLTGLPPTPEELDAFIESDRPDAYQRVVDRLLASPAYGEHWGRYWLDLARYADTNGADENHRYPVAWRYRDYVIAAFNDDLPYDQFVHEQLAGDLLPADSRSERRRQLTATGFLVLGPKMLAEQDKEKLVADIVDEQIDTVGQVFLGLTLGCARCHDHKFDPITAEDYYSLAGIFHSTKTMEHLDHVSQWMERGLPDPQKEAELAAHQQRLEDAKKRLEEIETDNPSAEEEQKIEEAKQAVKELEESMPELDTVMAVDEASVQLVALHVRGNHLQLSGEPLPRSVPTVFEDGELQPPRFPAEHSGRLQFARWLTSPGHPLTARVMANRIWAGHFAKGLVDSPSNFGHRGKEPSHPDLLDWLARDFESSGWSIKRLHRELVLSSTYRMDWNSNPQAASRDPDNRLLWRQNRRRLRAEAIRDTLLAVAGDLDRAFRGHAEDLKGVTFPESSVARDAFNGPRRTVYLSINRAALDDFFSTFDYVDPAASLEKRPATTVPHQALFLMNHALPLHAGRALALNILESADERPQRVELAYKTLFSRHPTDRELSAAEQFFSAADKKAAADEMSSLREAWISYCRALLLTNELLYVD